MSVMQSIPGGYKDVAADNGRSRSDHARVASPLVRQRQRRANGGSSATESRRRKGTLREAQEREKEQQAVREQGAAWNKLWDQNRRGTGIAAVNVSGTSAAPAEAACNWDERAKSAIAKKQRALRESESESEPGFSSCPPTTNATKGQGPAARQAPPAPDAALLEQQLDDARKDLEAEAEDRKKMSAELTAAKAALAKAALTSGELLAGVEERVRATAAASEDKITTGEDELRNARRDLGDAERAKHALEQQLQARTLEWQKQSSALLDQIEELEDQVESVASARDAIKAEAERAKATFATEMERARVEKERLEREKAELEDRLLREKGSLVEQARSEVEEIKRFAQEQEATAAKTAQEILERSRDEQQRTLDEQQHMRDELEEMRKETERAVESCAEHKRAAVWDQRESELKAGALRDMEATSEAISSRCDQLLSELGASQEEAGALKKAKAGLKADLERVSRERGEFEKQQLMLTEQVGVLKAEQLRATGEHVLGQDQLGMALSDAAATHDELMAARSKLSRKKIEHGVDMATFGTLIEDMVSEKRFKEEFQRAELEAQEEKLCKLEAQKTAEVEEVKSVLQGGFALQLESFQAEKKEELRTALALQTQKDKETTMEKVNEAVQNTKTQIEESRAKKMVTMATNTACDKMLIQDKDRIWQDEKIVLFEKGGVAKKLEEWRNHCTVLQVKAKAVRLRLDVEAAEAKAKYEELQRKYDLNAVAVVTPSIGGPGDNPATSEDASADVFCFPDGSTKRVAKGEVGALLTDISAAWVGIEKRDCGGPWELNAVLDLKPRLEMLLKTWSA
jgi:hypothetical protein